MEKFENEESDIPEIQDVAIIHEIYDGENAHEAFENELERALEAKYSTIVVEPSKLGDETARWISIGNCLHKTSVLMGFGSIASAFMWPDRLYICCPMGCISFFCAGLYSVSWQCDPCCKYQVEYNPKKLARLNLHTFTSTSPVVLVRHDDTRRKILHTTTSLLAVASCAWLVYKMYKQ